MKIVLEGMSELEKAGFGTVRSQEQVIMLIESRKAETAPADVVMLGTEGAGAVKVEAEAKAQPSVASVSARRQGRVKPVPRRRFCDGIPVSLQQCAIITRIDPTLAVDITISKSVEGQLVSCAKLSDSNHPCDTTVNERNFILQEEFLVAPSVDEVTSAMQRVTDLDLSASDDATIQFGRAAMTSCISEYQSSIKGICGSFGYRSEVDADQNWKSTLSGPAPPTSSMTSANSAHLCWALRNRR